MSFHNVIWFFIILSLAKSIINRLVHGKHSKHMTRAEYQLYLQSIKWKNKRQQVFQKYGKQCVLCGNSNEKDLVIHHRRYDNVGNEPTEDLIPLCKSCHSSYHKAARNKERHI